LDSGVAFGAGRLGPSEVAPGPVPLPFHGPYIAQEMVSRSSPGVLRHKEIRRNMSAVMKTASESAAGDSGHRQKSIAESGLRSALKTELRYRGQINTRADISLIRLVGPAIEVARAGSLVWSYLSRATFLLDTNAPGNVRQPGFGWYSYKSDVLLPVACRSGWARFDRKCLWYLASIGGERPRGLQSHESGLLQNPHPNQRFPLVTGS
jgi:hypothetical protein